MMREPIVLVKRDDPEQKAALYACANCGHVYSPRIYLARNEIADKAAYDAAANCYDCRESNTCSSCGKECGKHWLKCAECRRESAFEAAEKIPPSGVEHCFGYGGEFYHSAEEAQDAGEPWVFASTFHPFRADAGSILDCVIDDHHEDASIDDLNGVTAFEAAVDAFNKAQTSGSYFEDRTKIVILAPRPEEVAA